MGFVINKLTVQLSAHGRFIKCGSRGGTGVRRPPGKSHVIWVSIGN